MFCTPTCAACKAAGSCPLGQEPAAFVPPPMQPVRVRTDHPAPAQLAAILASLGRYVPLACGHYTTREEIERYYVWAPKPKHKHLWCDTCGAYREKQAEKRAESIPEEPLF